MEGLPAAEGRALIHRVLRAMVPSWDCIYRHEWRPGIHPQIKPGCQAGYDCSRGQRLASDGDTAAGDAVVWDNRQFMHRATPYDPAAGGRRLMWRLTLAGGVQGERVDRHGWATPAAAL